MLKLAARGLLIGFLLAPAALSAQEKVEKQAAPIKQSEGVAPKAITPDNETAKAPAKQKSQPTKALPAPPVQSERPTEPACDTRCQEAEQREKDDLKAQGDMAEAAFALVDISWWQFGAGVVGIVLLLVTLWYTRKATHIASDTAKHQLRAYMLLGKPEIRLDDDGTATAFVRLINSGNTPAMNFEMSANMSVLDHPYEGVIIGVQFSPGSKSPIRSGGDAQIALIRKVPSNERAAIRQGKKAIYISGTAEYIDVFGRNQTTKIRLMYHGPWEGTQSLAICPEGNEAT